MPKRVLGTALDGQVVATQDFNGTTTNYVDVSNATDKLVVLTLMWKPQIELVGAPNPAPQYNRWWVAPQSTRRIDAAAGLQPWMTNMDNLSSFGVGQMNYSGIVPPDDQG